MGKLTAKAVDNALPKDKEYKLSDGSGLSLRVRPSGSKSWLFCFRLPGSSDIKRMTLGCIEDLSLKEVRLQLPKLRMMVSEGIDPRNARAALQAENTQAVTMQVLFEAWIVFTKVSGKVTPAWIERHEERWRLHLQKPLGNILAKSVTRAHLAKALDVMIHKGIKEQARKALTTLNLLLDYGVTRHLIDLNSARALKPKDFGVSANRPQDRALSILELRQVWKALDQAIMLREGIASSATLMPITATAIKLLILTGARRSEVAGMRWDELNLESGMWVLAEERTKNRKKHTIYLGPCALELINDLKLLNYASDFVFDTGRGSAHIHAHSLTTAIQRLRLEVLADLKPFSLHDLRRSASTSWGEHLKVDPHIIERMLNHQPINKLMATYQRAVYATEQKVAWLAWDRMVDTHVAQDLGNVVLIKSVINE